MVQSELEPGTCPAWQPRHGHSSKRRLYFTWRRRSSVQNTLFLCAGKCSIFEMTGGKKKGRQGRFRKMRPTPCWGILKCHPGLQREKQSKRKIIVRKVSCHDSLLVVLFNWSYYTYHLPWTVYRVNVFKPFLFLSKKVRVHSCPTLCDPMDYTLHGILQARILEWVAFPIRRGYFWPRSWTGVSSIAGGFFTNWAIRKTPLLNRRAIKRLDFQSLPVQETTPGCVSSKGGMKPWRRCRIQK